MFFQAIKNYNKQTALHDFMAAITVGLIAFPLAISFSTAIGAPPQAGFIATIIGGLIAAVFGGTHFIVTGPAAAYFLVGIEAVSQIGLDGLVLSTFIAGGILITAGIMRIGVVIDYIPYSVILGFSSALSVVIISTLLKDCLGLNDILKVGNVVVRSWTLYFQNFQNMNGYAVLMSILVIAPMRYFRRSQYPVFVIILLIATLLTMLFDLPLTTIGSKYPDFSWSIPKPQWPGLFSIENVVNALPFSLTIASIGLINALLSTAIVYDKTNKPVNANQELIAQGLANIGVSFFAGIPVAATVSRTITNIENNAKTPMASIFQALLVFVLLLFSVKFLRCIPFACLNAVFLSVAFDMLQIKKMWEHLKIPYGEPLVCLVAFFMTIFLNNGVAILSGIVVASFLFMHRMSQLTNIQSKSHLADMHHGIKVYNIDGPFFFGAASRLKIILEEPHIQDKVIILNLKNMPLIDATGSVILSRLIKNNKDTEFIMANVNQSTHEFFEQIGLPKKRHYTVTKNLEEAIVIAQKILGENK